MPSTATEVLLSTPIRTYSRDMFVDIHATYGRLVDRAMRMPTATFLKLVEVLKPQLSRRGVPAEMRTAIALQHLGGGSHVDISAALDVHPATGCRALWDAVYAVNLAPLLSLDFQLENPAPRLTFA